MPDYSHMPWGDIVKNDHGVKRVLKGWMNRTARRAVGERGRANLIGRAPKRVSGGRTRD